MTRIAAPPEPLIARRGLSSVPSTASTGAAVNAVLAVWVITPVTRVVPAPVIAPPDHVDGPPSTNVPVPPSVPEVSVVAPLAVTVPVAFIVRAAERQPIELRAVPRARTSRCRRTCTAANSPVEPLPPPSSSTPSMRPSLSIGA